jgi:DUF4097 and DUF4098 domain-containing protein YvlB
MVRSMFTLTALALVLLGASGAEATEIDKSFHETFDVAPGFRLRLDHGDGDVVISPWDQDVIDVKVHYHADITKIGFGSGEPDFTVDFKERDNEVQIIGRESSVKGVFIVHSVRMHDYTYTISAPSYVALELRGDDGDIEITGWRAAVDCLLDDGDVHLSDIVGEHTRIDLEDGDIRVDRIEGEFIVEGDDGDVMVTASTMPYARIELEDGDVTIKESAGDFEIDVDDGKVTFYGVTASRVEVRCEDGDVDLGLLGTGEIDLDIATDNGDVDVTLEEGVSLSYLITMDDGRVSVDLPGGKNLAREEHSVSGEVGDGSGRVRIRTMDGDVVLRESP